MDSRFSVAASALTLALMASPALAQGTQSGSADGDSAEADNGQPVIIVTATRREAALQDVPLSVSAFRQEELNEQGIVGYERLARETPGVVVNRPTQNFNNFTARGISTNGYSAGLQAPVAIYIDELPISANGNSTILDPNLYDVERVEFLRGPQGTLFGSGSLSGAMRIITNAPNPNRMEASALVDFGYTEGGGLRQRYNAMVNIPLKEDEAAFRAVGYYKHEKGWVDNIGTGIKNSNTLDAFGIRASLLARPTEGFTVRITASHEDSQPKDSALTNPALGKYVRRSDRPDQFYGKLSTLNATMDIDFGFAELTSSSTYANYDQYFVVDLAGTFAQAFPFALDAYAYDEIFVQEARLASTHDGPVEWIIGGFYFDKRREVDFNYRSSPEYLASKNLTGLPDEYYQRFSNYTDIGEKAVFGELSYHFDDSFWITGGLRYGSADVQTTTRAGGYTSNYLTLALFGRTNRALTITPVASGPGAKASESQVTWKASVSYKPSDDVTTYATISTGFRPPVVNARAGLASSTDPDDLIIPPGAESDKLTNYEIGLKGRFLDGDLTASLAAFYIDWNNIQIQANRVSDAVQFATNIGGAVSKGFEFELVARPVEGLRLSATGAYIDAKIDDLSDEEAAISGAVDGIRLATPKFSSSVTATYTFPVGDTEEAFITGNMAYVGSFPGLFPNTPGKPTVPSPLYDFTEEYTYVNAYAGIKFSPDLSVTAYVENLFDNDAITYVHPEAFIDGKYARLQPRTFGIRTSIAF